MKHDYWLRPPEIAEENFDRATSGPCWAKPGRDQTRLCYVTDAEASSLSGVPERSLLVLQDADVIRATQAPKLHGGFKRVWHLPEVARAALAENLRNAAGLNYRDAAASFWHAAFMAGVIFKIYCALEGEPHEKTAAFSPELIIADSAILALRCSPTTQSIFEKAFVDDAPSAPELFTFDDQGVAIIAATQKGEWKAAIRDQAPVAYARARARFIAAKYLTVVRPSYIFRELEIKAKKLR